MKELRCPTCGWQATRIVTNSKSEVFKCSGCKQAITVSKETQEKRTYKAPK